MSKRLYYLADGTLRTVTAGRFRGDDEVAGKIITERIVVRDDGALAHGAPVQMDPNNPEGPLVIRYESATGQEALSVYDVSTQAEVFEIETSGAVNAFQGISASNVACSQLLETDDLDVGGLVSGSAFDTGTWVPDNSAVPVPTVNTVVTRNATTESVYVSNLRVGRRTAQPKSFAADGSGQLVNDPSGEYAGDGIAMGLYFEEGEFNDILRCVPPTNALDKGACVWAQSDDDLRIYRFGFDPEKNFEEDGLHFTDNRNDPSNPRQIRLALGLVDNSGAMGMFVNDTCNVQICKGTNAIECNGPLVGQDIKAVGDNGLRFKNKDGTTHLSIANDGLFTLQNPADDAVFFQVNHDTLTMNSESVQISGASTAATRLQVVGNVTCDDLECTVLTASDVYADTVEIKSGVANKSAVLTAKNAANVTTFELFNTGELRFLHNFDDTGQAATVHSSIVASDQSVYIGSARYSYDRSNHVVMLHRLTQNHIPIYLQGRGFTSNDLPSGHQHDDMSVRKWLVHARTHFSEEDIDISDLFPTANTGDWVQIDAPVPTLQGWATGADADISTLETEMDAAEGRLTALEVLATENEEEGLFGDGTVYIGSARLSFNRSNYVLKIKVLKPDHIPKFLSDQGYTTANLPAGRTINTMNVRRWRNTARNFTGTTTLQASDLFPGGSLSDDWDNVDAPIPVAEAAIVQLETDRTSHDTRITALENGGGGGGGSPEAMDTVYVDGSYSGALGSSDGSQHKPYVSLKTAMETKLASGTTSVTFKVAPGVYTGAISIDRSTAEQSFTVEGSGQDCTFVQAGVDFSSGGTSNVIYLRDFKDVTIRNLTIRYGAYGLYPRSCTSCTVQNVRFIFLGSDGQANRHDLSATQQQQADFWASASTSNGGACRIRSCDQVHVTDCVVDRCARGLRIQDCGNAATVSLVSQNRTSRTLESGVYLAAGSYTNSDGCVNFMVSGNIVHEAYNNGILLIGGQNCSVVANTIVGTASAGIQQWHGLDNSIIGNTVTNCNRLQHNGVGNLGDAHANVHIAGSTNIRAGGSYIALVHNNTICDCNQGRGAAVYGIRLGSDIALSYPSESAKASVDGNHIDAATRVHNNFGTVLQATADPGGSSTPETFTVENDSAEAELVIRSTQTAAGNEQVSLTFHLDRSGSENFISDASYVFQNYGSDLDFNSVQYPGHLNETSRLAYKVLGNGQMVFSGSGETGGITNVLPYCGYNGGDDLRFLGSSRFFCNVQIGSVADVEEKLLSIPTAFTEVDLDGDQAQFNTPLDATDPDDYEQLADTLNLEVHCAGMGGYGALTHYLLKLPVARTDKQRIKIYNGGTWVGLSWVYSTTTVAGGDDGSKLLVRDGETLAGGVAGNSVIKITSSFAEAVCRIRDGKAYWLVTNGENVTNTAL
ncbi:MAG: hypothetical protein CMH98_17340 [Oceanospirillaceae bacterium]|nr:hypothetical protein [Oceanospirillaceae bacterium]